MRPILLLVFVMVWPARVFAWNPYGHMVVAASAWDQIANKTARKRIVALLKLNPQYADWVEGVPASRRDQVAFVMAATWPDLIKKDPQYTADGTDKGNRPANVPASSQNEGYADKLMHKYWHFIDVPFSSDGTPTQPPDFVNAETQIEAFRTALKSADVSDDVKSYDLVWLEHLVGDVHQPLHCVSRFDAAQTDGDNGGNFVKLSGTPANLHAFWDDALGPADGDAGAAIAAARKLTPPSASLAKVSNVATWIDESVQAAKTHVYRAPIDAGPGPFTVDATYAHAAEALARKRAALAGARLAHLLTAALK
jgi:hypothetical protein